MLLSVLPIGLKVCRWTHDKDLLVKNGGFAKNKQTMTVFNTHHSVDAWKVPVWIFDLYLLFLVHGLKRITGLEEEHEAVAVHQPSLLSPTNISIYSGFKRADQWLYTLHSYWIWDKSMYGQSPAEGPSRLKERRLLSKKHTHTHMECTLKQMCVENQDFSPPQPLYPHRPKRKKKTEVRLIRSVCSLGGYTCSCFRLHFIN